MRKLLFLAFCILLLVGCATVPEAAEAESPKLYADVTVSRLLRIIDGDTFAVDIDSHTPIAGKNISIRLRGINTPELQSKNEEERKSATLEKQRLSDLLTNARIIELKNLGRDKYFRINADVYIDGEPLLPKLNERYLLKKGVDK